MDVAVTGSSGLIGSVLMPALDEAGHRPIALVRRAPAAGTDEISWDPQHDHVDTASLEGIDAIINLAGAGIADRRWNDKVKDGLVRSRTGGTSLIATTAAGLAKKPRVFLSASAIGFYGSRGDEILTESSASGHTFTAALCRQWEAASQPASDAGIRTASLRTGIVLTPRGGALAKQLPLFKLGLGGKFRSGRQYQSWISLSDEVAAIIHLLNGSAAGPVNLTAPNPLRNVDFTKTLGRVLGRPSFLRVPSFATRSILGREMADALLGHSQRVLPTVLEASGYLFKHPDLESALQAELLLEE